MDNYLVFKTGCEGIEEVFGVFDRDAAIAFVMQKKTDAQESQKRGEIYQKLYEKLLVKYGPVNDENILDKIEKDPEMIAFQETHGDEDRWDDPDYWCVVTVSHQGTNCVCTQLGVRPSRLMLR